jgi:TPR repeat protein
MILASGANPLANFFMNRLILIFWVCLGSCDLVTANEAEEIYQSAKPMISNDASPASKQLGLAVMREAAEKGHPKAQSIIGFHLAKGEILPKDFTKAIAYLQNSATSGDFYASRNLRVLCETRGGESAENRADAVVALTAAANAGSVPAAAQLGELYFLGDDETLSQDYHLAKRFLQIAADKSDLQSCNTLGVIYEQGLEGDVDKQAAFAYFEKAANGGHAKAQASLGFAYAGGGGVDYDLVQAYKWFTLSALQGEVTGRNALPDFARGLSEEQIAAGNKQVVEFLQKQGKEIPKNLLQNKAQSNAQGKGRAE